jgi:hypothetical protein
VKCEKTRETVKRSGYRENNNNLWADDLGLAHSTSEAQDQTDAVRQESDLRHGAGCDRFQGQAVCASSPRVPLRQWLHAKTYGTACYQLR